MCLKSSGLLHVFWILLLASSAWAGKVGIAVLPPSGMIASFNASVCPEGWSPLDGTSGNPDARGRAIVGAGQGPGLTNRILASLGGEESHSLSIAEIPSHNHSLQTDIDNNNCGLTDPSGNYLGNPGAGNKIYSSLTGAASFGASLGNTGSGSAHNTMMPFVALLWCVKN